MTQSHLRVAHRDTYSNVTPLEPDDTRVVHEQRHSSRSTENRKVLSMADDLEHMGPIDYLVVEFPGNRFTGNAFPMLVDLVDRGLIRILDLAFVRKDLDGSVVGLELKDVDGDGELDLSVFVGVSSGLLGPDDLQEAGSVLEPDTSAGILVYENVWAAPLAREIRLSGGQLVASGRIPVQQVLAALDASELAH
jgi:Family of unknown function (DUF6325)